MSCSSEPSAYPQCLHVNEGHIAEPLPVSNSSPVQTLTNATKRSEVLRHIFPLPSRGSLLANQNSIERIPKTGRDVLSPTKQSKSRVTFHKVITSFFNNSSSTPANGNQRRARAGSRASSIRSQPRSIYDSIENLDVVSPTAFIFSSPSLRSTHSASMSKSTSRLPSLTENDSESYSLRRVQSASFSVDSVSLLDDEILEPFFEHGITRSMSGVLLGYDELDRPIPEDSEEDFPTLADSPNRHIVPSDPFRLDAIVISFALPHLNTASKKAMRLVCQSWRSTLDHITPPRFPSSYSAPTEILQQIYSYLGPKDFNAARHTCRNWMRASLNKSLLVTMLNRGGWWSGAASDLEQRDLMSNLAPESKSTSEEWFLSRSLSRECSLSSAHRGNGLYAFHSSIVEVSQTNFAELANGYSASVGRQQAALIFTTSVCGKLLLVARDTLIYIYELRGAVLRSLTSVSCPRRVLAMSMDVSSGRNAVAMLLEGRMGMVCELRCGRNTGTDSPVELHIESHGQPYRTTTRTSIITSRAVEYDAGMEVADLRLLRPRSPRPNINEQDHIFNQVDVQANYHATSLQNINDQRMYDQNRINQTWNLTLRGPASGARNKGRVRSCGRTVPIESGTSTFYRHLCSEDDPPRSVSICPQRRCVAFGCSAGIELHWIDALTGQSLSRWFPLTAPSDYLYFLSPRPGFESAKKLRLISSAAHPEDRPAICHKFFGPPTLSSFWSSFGLDTRIRRPGSSCDHYHAVPLSDGHHVLFIDPPTGKLFLGCDAPLGGPTKLLRKVLFVPPEDVGNQIPRLYTAASDLTWGARVAVAFGDQIVLYSVPPDIFTLSRLEQKAESWDVYTAPPFTHAGRTKDHWLNWWDEPYTLNRPDLISSIWPIAVRGTMVGTLAGVCELAVVTRPNIAIWAFGLDSRAKTWQVAPGKETGERRYVCRSGIVHDTCTGSEAATSPDDGSDFTSHSEVEMEYPDKTVSDPPDLGFDGNSSQILVKCMSKAMSVENDDWVEFVDVRGCEAWYDENGDVFTMGVEMDVDSIARLGDLED